MSTLTVSQGIVGTYNGNKTPAYVRLYANQTFTESNGVRVPAGALDSENFYCEIAVSFAGSTVTVPSANIYTTTDSNAPDASYTMALYDASGVRLGVLYQGLRLAPDLTPATWQNIETFSRIRRTVRRDEYYTKEEVNTLIADFDAANPAILALQEAEFADDYDSFADAVSAIGDSVETHLIITQREEIDANLTIPDNIRISVWGNGGFTVKTGVTLTVGKMDDAGNRQVFWFADNTANVRFLSNAVEKINIRWFVSDVGDCTYAVNQAIASAVANEGGVIYFPQGDWTTAGNHAVCGNLIIDGDGIETSKVSASSLLDFEDGDGIFVHGAQIYDVTVRNLTIDGGSKTVAGYQCAADYGDGSSGRLRFENVKIANCTYGLRIYDTLSAEWQMAAVSFDAKCRFSNNTYGIWCNTSNNVLQCDAFFGVGANQWAGYVLGAGQWTFTGEFAGSQYIGVNQIESQTIVAASGITAPGVATATVTAAGMTGSPRAVSVNVDVTMTTASLIAAAYRKALGADSSVTSFFHIGGTGATILLIALDPAANDATMNLAINTGTASGITNSSTSANTAAGVADTTQAQGFYFNNAHGNINFLNTADEGFRNFIVSDTSDYDSCITFQGASVRAPIRLNGNCELRTVACSILDRAVREAPGANPVYLSIGDVVTVQTYFGGAFRTLSALRTHNFSGNTALGYGQILEESIPSEVQSVSQAAHRIFHNDTGFFEARAKGRMEVMSSVDPSGGDDWVLLRLGRCSPTGDPLFYYDFKRRYTNGRLILTGNQTSVNGAVGLDFNGDITAVNFRGAEVSPSQITSNQNNWNPGTSAQNILVTTDASRNITGMVFDYAQNGGDVRVIENIGSFDLVIVNQSSSSTAGNRFLTVTGGDLTIAPNGLAVCIYDGTTRRWRTFAPGNLRSSNTTGVGYAVGAGGTVSQATSRTTGVTLNKTTGAITLVSAAGSATPASFTVTNSTVAATDTIIVNQKSGTDKYIIAVTAVGAGSFQITSYTTGGTTTEQPVFNFCVLKGVAS